MVRHLTSCVVVALMAVALGLSVPAASGVSGEKADFPMVSTIAFTSTRDNPAFFGPGMEIYLMDADGTNVRRLTENTSAEAFPTLSPDGKGRIVFDSNRLRLPTEPGNTSDLFLMNKFGEEQTFLTRGSSASWSPDSKAIVYHRSASLTGRPIEPTQPGTATSDSDIFVIDNLGDFQDGLIQPRNLTNSPDEIDDDADWSPLGNKIVYVSKDQADAINHPTNPTSAELFVRNADGTGEPTQLTSDLVEERAPTWSPDGTRILFMCRLGPPPPGSQVPTFELCVINPDGSGFMQLTNDPEPQVTPTWSPDGSQIVYHTAFRNGLDPATLFPLFELIRINANGTGREQVTNTPGLNFIAKYGVIRDTGWGN